MSFNHLHWSIFVDRIGLALTTLDTFLSICIPKSAKPTKVKTRDRATKTSVVTMFSETGRHCY